MYLKEFLNFFLLYLLTRKLQ